MTTGTPRKEEEVTSFWSSMKASNSSSRVPGGIPPAISRGREHPKKTGPSLCFKAVPVLGDCCIHDSILESARFGHLDIVLEKALFLSIFCVIPIEMFV